MSDDHPYRRLLGRQREATSIAAREAYEEGRLRYFLKTFGCPAYAKTLKEDAQKARGSWRASFIELADWQPSFPWLLGGDDLDGVKLHTDSRALVPSLLGGGFLTAPFNAAFDAFIERCPHKPHGRGYGLVFRRKGIPQGLIIVDDEVDLPKALVGTVLTHRREEGHVVHVLSYAVFLAAIRSSRMWAPEL